MLKRAPKEGSTVSVVHLNAAQWHYDKACFHYGQYEKCVNERGLIDPFKLALSKLELSNYRYHTQQGDVLMRRPGAMDIRGRVRNEYKPDTRLFPDDFELALIQRGNSAKKAYEAEHGPLALERTGGSNGHVDSVPQG